MGTQRKENLCGGLELKEVQEVVNQVSFKRGFKANNLQAIKRMLSVVLNGFLFKG